MVELLDTDLNNPRLIRVSPNGDLFVAESGLGRIRVSRAAQKGGKLETRIFAKDLNQPFGIAFWPPGSKRIRVCVPRAGAQARLNGRV